jgi:hypothetical protein
MTPGTGMTALEPITSPDDPRLAGMGREGVAGADQIPGLLAITPDERLDRLVAVLRFVDEGRAALRQAHRHGSAATQMSPVLREALDCREGTGDGTRLARRPGLLDWCRLRR